MDDIKKRDIEVPIEDTAQNEEDFDLSEIPQNYRIELASLGPENAKEALKHIVLTYRYLETQPQKAVEEAKKSVQLGSRLAVLRETLGLAAYRAGDWALAVRELKTARRMNGINDYLPLIADSYRGLGEPEKVFEIASTVDASNLPQPSHIEMSIVLAGAYADVEKYDVALSVIARELSKKHLLPTASRLRLLEARGTIFEQQGNLEDAEKVWKVTEPIRMNLEEPASSDFIVYDIEEEG
jgi:tetratricopeptide (TPR) repeat protein